VLHEPPPAFSAAEILPENLPNAWSDGTATALSIATALAIGVGLTLPWKTVQDVIAASLKARFTELEKTSGPWPCDLPGAQSVRMRAARGGVPPRPEERTGGVSYGPYRIAEAELEPAEVQDLGDLVPKLLEVKAKSNVPLKFIVRVRAGDGETAPPEDAVRQISGLLEDIKKGFTLR
jgi:hypothetical protein